MARVMFFVDGFNVYHSIKSNHRKFLWLDFRSLAELVIPKTDTIPGIYYFSAFAYWRPDSVRRHKIYVSALETRGINSIMGKFKKKTRTCPRCGDYLAREEKQTDVNIALQMYHEACSNNYDRAVLVSGDTDLIPAITLIKNTFPVQITVMFPMSRVSEDLKRVCDRHIKIKEKHLASSQLPDEIRLSPTVVLQRPSSWT